MGNSPGQALSQQDIQDLQDIASKLPQGHPMVPKISTLLNSQQTQFEQQRDPDRQTGFFGSLADRISEMFKSSPSVAGTILGPAGDIVANSYAAAKRLPMEDRARREQGRSLGYRGAAAIGSVTGVADPVSSEQAADIGDAGAVAGNAAFDVAPVVAGELAGRVIPSARQGLARRIYDAKTGNLKFPTVTELGQRVVAGPDPYASGRPIQGVSQPVSSGPGPYTGPRSVPKPVRISTPPPEAFPGATSSGSPSMVPSTSGQTQLRQPVTSPAPSQPSPFGDATSTGRPSMMSPASAQTSLTARTAQRVKPESLSARTGSNGVRPSPSEVEATELLRKPIVTPEENARGEQLFGKAEWRRQRGEGTMRMQARQAGMTRARRAGQGMEEPE